MGARRLMLALASAVLAVVAGAPPAGAQTAPAPTAVWVQWAADGAPHVRAIVPAGALCPSLTAGGTTTPLAVRAPALPGFDDVVCDLALPANASGARVGGVALPAIPRAPKLIALFGDTGCRLKGAEVQACNDPAAWPFPTIAQDVAAAHPDLVIHVGDYYYRETSCPAGVDCSGSPHGDVAASWYADWFAPMAPLLAVAPVVVVRGNHEDCNRSPLGWARYLSGLATVGCVDHEPIAFATFDDLLVGEVDDATEVTENLADPPVFVADEAGVDARAATAKRETWLVVHRPPVAYEIARAGQANFGSNLAAIISGHIHTFGAYAPAGEPPQVLVGMGGDNLAADTELKQLEPLNGLTDRRFGYALFRRNGDGWDITVYDTNRAVHRRCRLANRSISCGPALTGSDAGTH
jgi:hypothetical protein